MRFEFTQTENGYIPSENSYIPSDDLLTFLSLNDGASPKWFVSSLKQQCGIHEDKAHVSVWVCVSEAVPPHSDAEAAALW